MSADLTKKPCTKCGLVKPRDAFRRHPQVKSGLSPRCKECLNVENRDYYYATREQRLTYERERRVRLPEEIRKRTKEAQDRYLAIPGNREKISRRKRHGYMTQRYGLTPEKYEEMERRQGGLCGICGGPPNGRYDRLHVDHCHKTGKIRALLCYKCNVGLGNFLDDTSLLSKALNYLTTHQSEPRTV